MVAAKLCEKNSVLCLIEMEEVDKGAKSTNGRTALHWAATNPNTCSIEVTVTFIMYMYMYIIYRGKLGVIHMLHVYCVYMYIYFFSVLSRNLRIL